MLLLFVCKSLDVVSKEFWMKVLELGEVLKMEVYEMWGGL